MMTTMAALLGGLPLALGERRRIGAAAAAGHHDHRRLDLQSAAHALHDAGDLPGVRSPRGAGARSAGRSRHRPRIGTLVILGTLHPPAGRDDAADRRARAVGHPRLQAAAGLAAAAGRFPDDRRDRQPAGREPGDHGVGGGDAARAAVRPDRRRQRDDLVEPLGSTSVVLQFDLDRDIDAAARDVQAAINAARGQLPAEPAGQPDLSQGQSGRRAGDDSGADVGHGAASAHVRRRVVGRSRRRCRRSTAWAR